MGSNPPNLTARSIKEGGFNAHLQQVLWQNLVRIVCKFMNATYFPQWYVHAKIVLEHGQLEEVTLRIWRLYQLKEGALMHS